MNLLSYIRAKHNFLFKLVIVAIVSAFISLMLPDVQIDSLRVDGFTNIWSHEDLVVDKDFFIEKSPKMLELERNAISENAPVFFEQRNDDLISKQQKLENLKLKNVIEYELLKPIFDSIYLRGVIESSEDEVRNKNVFVYNSGFAESASYYDFFTIQTALDYIQQKLGNKKLTNNYLDFLAINLFLSKEKNALYLNSKLEQISLYKTIIRNGQVLVAKGETLNDEKRELINAYITSKTQGASISALKSMAKFGLTFILCMVLLTFLAFFRRPIFGQNKQVAFIFMLMLVAVISINVFYKNGLMILALPFALFPILVRVFFDGRTALFTYLMIVLLCSFFMPDKLEFILLELIPGIGTLFAIAEMRRRQQILNAAALVFVFYVLIFITYQISYGTPQTVYKFSSYIPFVISSTLVLLAYPAIYLIEKFFGFISDFRLLELSDLNHPLLRRLSHEIPGTFQHSLQVANLAEEAIYYIGGNSLLVRTGAMYHDIGKLQNPYFFTENQANGFSPHQEMDPIESAKIIINHVIVGIEMAKEYKLPEQVIDFIRTHHGTTSVSYFLHLYKKQTGLKTVNAENEFRYPGPIPFSKETAVLMIADGVEAASRSLKSHDAMSINDLVDQIVDYKVANNQLINSDITFKDITTIKKIFKKRLMNIYHARIEYPS